MVPMSGIYEYFFHMHTESKMKNYKTAYEYDL